MILACLGITESISILLLSKFIPKYRETSESEEDVPKRKNNIKEVNSFEKVRYFTVENVRVY